MLSKLVHLSLKFVHLHGMMGSKLGLLHRIMPSKIRMVATPSGFFCSFERPASTGALAP
jgi:hypothetical protein